MSGVAVMHDDERHLFLKSSQLGKRIDGWIEEELRMSTVAQLHTKKPPLLALPFYNIHVRPDRSASDVRGKRE